MSETFDVQLQRLREMAERHPSDYVSDEDMAALAELLRRWDAEMEGACGGRHRYGADGVCARWGPAHRQ